MYRIKSVRSWSFARTIAIFSFIAGFIPIIFSVVTLSIMRYNYSGYGYPSQFELTEFVWFLAVPLISALVGAVAGLIISWIYNFFGARGYALEIDIELVAEAPAAQNGQPVQAQA